MPGIQRILIIGALGQIGTELTLALRDKYGAANVLASDIRLPSTAAMRESGPFETCDVTCLPAVGALVQQHKPDAIVNMAAILSAVGEKNPQLCWQINMVGLHNVLEVALAEKTRMVFCPSSIAVFGPKTPREDTPQETILEPSTMYGVTKVSGELLCDYYVNRFGLDVRGVRYPGIISAATLPGGGTTDYAVDIFYKAVSEQRFTCFLSENTRLPMMYMPDCLKATMDLMEAPFARLKHHSNYNIAAFSFTPAELAEEIRKHIPRFTITYEPDYHQEIADSWPRSINDQAARDEWDWQPGYCISRMTREMLEILGERHSRGELYPGKTQQA